MGKLQAFRIEFDQRGATYAPGDTVTGKVVLILSGPKNVREIRVKAKGRAEVSWSEDRTVTDSDGKSHTETDYYSNSETYFNKCIVLVSPTRGEDSTTIPAGTHSYPFSFHIPTNVPCSFEHNTGHVRYTAKAVLDRPWRFDHKSLSAFTVVADYDLNAHPDLARGINDEAEREFHSCLCFIYAGSLNVKVRSRVRGFVPGETIQLDISYDNCSSSVDVEEMRLCFYKRLIFHATTKSKTDSTDIKNVRAAGPFPKKGKQSLCIQVPSIPPSNLEHCSIINISYGLELKIHTSGLHHKIKRYYAIAIGTIPLYNRMPILSQPSAPTIDQVTEQDNESLPPYQQVVGVQPIGFVDRSPSPYPEMPPPTYEECISGSKLIGDPNEQGMFGSNMQYAPRYPVYKFPMPMPHPPGSN